MSCVFLLIGSNEGDRGQLISKAIHSIRSEIGNVLKASSLYETEPWGFQSKNSFLNQAISIETNFSPKELLQKIIQIEKNLGRLRNSDTYESRLIDIDILFYENLLVDETELQIPHPQLHKRKFTLIPLSEIASDFIHPVFEERIDVLVNKCDDTSSVDLYFSNSL